MNKKILLVLTTLIPASLMAQTFSDDFESYTAGQYIGAASADWTTWSGATGGAEDTQVTTANANSGTNAVYYSSTSANGGPQDCVLNFGGSALTTGQFNYKMWMYVNATKGAYFNFQATPTIGQTWALDVTFNNTGTVEFTSGGSLVLSTSYPMGQWFEMQIDVNLNTNTWEFILDGTSQGSWQNTTNSIASIDIFPLQNHQFYVDDVEYTYTSFTYPTLNAAAYGINNLSGLATGQVTPDLVVRNLGNTALTSFDLLLDYNGNQYTENVTGVNVATNGTYTVSMSNPVTLASGTTPATLTVSNVNGTTDDYAGDDSKTIDVTTVSPAAGKMVVIEEATGTWCGWCPRGAVYMDMMDSKYPGFLAPIAVHNNDPMTVTAYDAGMGALIAGYPSALVDRGPEVDPSQVEPDFLNRIVTAPVTLLENGANWNSTTRVLDVSVTTTFDQNASGNYKIACILTENAVTGSASGYNQTNYYAGGSNGAMGGYESLPNPVPAAQMVYEFVARALSPGFGGLSNAFPASVTAGQQFVHNFSFTLPAAWDENEIHIVGVVYSPTGVTDNADYTTIAEAVSNGYDIGTSVGVAEIADAPDAEVSIYPNPSVDQTTINLNIATESNITIDIYSVDGKVIASKNYGTMTGSYNFPVNMSEWEKGIYLVKITTGDKVITQQIVKQ